MTKSANFIFLFIFTISSFGLSAQKGRVYRDKVNKFELTMPNEWKPQRKRNQKSFKLFASLHDDQSNMLQNAQLALFIENNSTFSLDTLAVRYLKNRHAQFESYNVTKSGEILINGLKFYWVIASYQIELEPRKILTYFSVINGKAIYLSFEARQSSKFENYEEQFKNIAESFRLTI